MVYKLPNAALEDTTVQFGKLDTTVTNAFVPIGGIIMWSGTIAEAEALTNWAICDGTNSTPDLRDKFVLGVGSSANTSTATKGEQGGNNTITLSEGQMPAHNHNITDNGHSHGDGTLTAATKTLTGNVRKISETFGGNGTVSGIFTKLANQDATLTPGGPDTSPTGGFSIDASHDHNITGSTGNNTTGITSETQGSGDDIDNRPSYFALCYIMRTS